MKKKTFVIIIYTIIFSTFVFVPFKEILIQLNIIDFYKGDTWKIIEKSNDKIYDKIMSIEANIENRYNNYFPFFNDMNNLYYNAIIGVDSLFYNDIYLKDNIDNEHLFYEKNYNFYYLVNHYNREQLKERLKNQAAFYNDINNKYPNIKLALYIPLRYSETSLKNINYNYDLIKDFTNQLNNNIQYSILDNSTISDYLYYFYKTDHHYNSYGAEKAYLDILKMFNINNQLNINHKIIWNNYYGSMAKSTLLTKTFDQLTAINVPNTLKVYGIDEKYKPLSLEKKDNIFYDYYVKYFDGQYDEIIYENNTNYNRNLLIICDSLAWQIDYLLANNFDKTFVINIRYGKWRNENLLLNSYIQNNNITDILFLQEGKNIVFNADNYDLYKKVIR